MIRFGIIGTNWITEEFIKAARDTGEIALTAVYSRTEERAREFGAQHDIPHLFTDVAAMAGSGEIDAVYIASPNSFHAQQAIVCMDRKVHVLCEKPVASNTAELKQMIEAAKRNGVLLMEAVKSTLLPGFAAIREHLPKLGPIRRYSASCSKISSRYDAYKQGNILNAFKPELSNGSLMDLGVYGVYPLMVLFGRPERVLAGGLMLESGVDGQGSLLLTYPGMDAIVLHSKIVDSHQPAEIQGEHGTMIIDKINRPENVHIHYRNGTVETIAEPHGSSNMIYEIKEFIDLIRAGRTESAVNSHDASLAAMETMDEARRQIGLVFPADDRL